MRGRIKLGLTSGALLAATVVAYHFCPPNSWHSASLATAAGTVKVMAPNASLATATAIQARTEPVKAAVTKIGQHTLRGAISSVELGMASWYGGLFNGKQTANGEVFDTDTMTACHRTLPFGTLVRVINMATGRSVVVRINDRGTMTPSRIIDLSHAAAAEIGMLGAGVARVRLEVLSKVRRTDTENTEHLAR